MKFIIHLWEVKARSASDLGKHLSQARGHECLAILRRRDGGPVDVPVLPVAVQITVHRVDVVLGPAAGHDTAWGESGPAQPVAAGRTRCRARCARGGPRPRPGPPGAARTHPSPCPREYPGAVPAGQYVPGTQAGTAVCTAAPPPRPAHPRVCLGSAVPPPRRSDHCLPPISRTTCGLSEASEI
jgi:hypothetical protein